MDAASVSKMLEITGSDTQSIGIKYEGKPYVGRITGKLWIGSNKVPNFNDPVLPTRLVKINFAESFYGREDRTLAARLIGGELPGIAQRTMRAYRRLLSRGRFIQPHSSRMLEEQVHETSDPYALFIRECLVRVPGGTVNKQVVYERFKGWCAQTGRLDELTALTQQKFSTNLVEAMGGQLSETREAGQPRAWVGWHLRTDEDKFNFYRKDF
jgi:phage/plasmid-associated DNA primase